MAIIVEIPVTKSRKIPVDELAVSLCLFSRSGDNSDIEGMTAVGS